MDYIGGMLNPIGKMHKTHYKNEFCNGFYWKKLMVHNYILLETIGIPVMVYIGLLLFFYLQGLEGSCFCFFNLFLFSDFFFVLNGYHYVYYLYELN